LIDRQQSENSRMMSASNQSGDFTMRIERRILPRLLGMATIFAAATPLLAAPVGLVGSGNTTFGGNPTTAGTTFTTSSGSITATNAAGASTITYSVLAGEIGASLNPGDPAQAITLGAFNSSSTALLSGPNFAGATVSLAVSFSVPSDVNPQTFNGILTGTIVQTASGASVLWATGALTFVSPTVGTFVVTLADPFTLVNAPGSPGASRVNGTIQLVSGPGPMPAIPEPGTMVLLGSGLLSLTAVARRARRSQ
jgi:hypothetical protein